MRKQTQQVAISKNVHEAILRYALDTQRNVGDAADFLLTSALKVRRVKIAEPFMVFRSRAGDRWIDSIQDKQKNVKLQKREEKA